jgi:hypothetical protein
MALETTMVIHMNDYRKAKAARLAVRRRSEELLCVNWNPAFGVIALSCFQSPQELSPQLPEESARLQPAFLSRVSALASQI